MLLELEKDLVHLERSGDGLNQDGASDRASWYAQGILGKLEYVIPKTSLEVVLHLGQVEVWAEASLQKLFGVVEEVKTKVKETAGHGLVVDSEVGLIQMPTSWSAIQMSEAGFENLHSFSKKTDLTRRTAGLSTSLYSFPVLGSLKPICLRMASRRFT